MTKFSKNIVGFVLCVVALMPTLVSAKSIGANGLALGSITTKTFGYQTVAIIANNPLYGFTKAFDSMRGYLVSDDVYEQALLETDRANRAAAELIRAYQVGPKNGKLMTKALTEYQGAIYRYTIALSKLTSDDTGAHTQFMNDEAINLMNHVQLTDDMGGWRALTNTHQAILRDVSERLTSAAVSHIQQHVGLEAFTQLVSATTEGRVMIEQIRIAETLNILAQAAARVGNDDLARTLLAARANLLSAIAATAPADFAGQLTALAGSDTQRLQSIEFLLSTPSLHENQELIDLRNQLLIKMF